MTRMELWNRRDYAALMRLCSSNECSLYKISAVASCKEHGVMPGYEELFRGYVEREIKDWLTADASPRKTRRRELWEARRFREIDRHQYTQEDRLLLCASHLRNGLAADIANDGLDAIKVQLRSWLDDPTADQTEARKAWEAAKATQYGERADALSEAFCKLSSRFEKEKQILKLLCRAHGGVCQDGSGDDIRMIGDSDLLEAEPAIADALDARPEEATREADA